jgi:Integrase zinc binding domain
MGGMDMKHTILHNYHDGVTAGHPGTWKTYASLLRSYWWPTLKPDVMEYVKGCATCQANKAITRRNVPPIDPIIPCHAFFLTVQYDAWTGLLTDTYQDRLRYYDEACRSVALWSLGE